MLKSMSFFCQGDGKGGMGAPGFSLGETGFAETVGVFSCSVSNAALSL